MAAPAPAARELLTCPATRAAIKARLAFATERWGGSGAVFAWDLWNEMHPAQGERPARTCFAGFHRRRRPVPARPGDAPARPRASADRLRVRARSSSWKPWLNEPIFRHPALDFASSHFYEEGTIDDPRDTVAPAISAGRLVREALAEITDCAPLLRQRARPDPHLQGSRPQPCPSRSTTSISATCSGRTSPRAAAGGGMRWPNRHPHTLTARHAAGAAGARRFPAAGRLAALPPQAARRRGHGLRAGRPPLRLRRRGPGGPLPAAHRHDRA